MNRRGFLKMFAAGAVAATTNPVHFLAPAGGWTQSTPGGLWRSKTPAEIMYDVSAALTGTWANYEAIPDQIWIPSSQLDKFAAIYALCRMPGESDASLSIRIGDRDRLSNEVPAMQAASRTPLRDLLSPAWPRPISNRRRRIHLEHLSRS